MRLPLTLLLLSCAAPLLGENWPNWRGPHYNGSTTETHLPDKFSPTDNVKWALDLPGPAASTPVIWENSVFLTTSNEDATQVEAWCLDRNSGEVKWKIPLSEGIFRDDRSTFASPSPVTNGKIVIFYTGVAELVATDFTGREIWRRNIQKDHGDFSFLWTYSSSPVLHKEKLYIQVLQRDEPVHNKGKIGNESFLLAIDAASGQDLWKAIRPSAAVAESKEAFTTPLPLDYQNRSEIILAGGDSLTGTNPETGEELWRWNAWNPQKIGHWRLVTSPVAGNGIILLAAPKKNPIYAIKAGGSGLLTTDAVAWTSDPKLASSDVSVPAFYKGHFYILDSDRKSLCCFDPASCKILWHGEIDSKQKIESSPTVADGKIYLISHASDVFVIRADPSAFTPLLKTAFGGPGSGERDVRSSIAISSGNLFIRTSRKIYCIGD